MKGYSSGMRKDRVTILNRTGAVQGKFGIDSDGAEWEAVGTVWASCEWQHGMRAMAEGALDAYSVVMVRMNWNPLITMRSRISHEGQVYQILPDTFHADRHENKIQFQAQAIIK